MKEFYCNTRVRVRGKDSRNNDYFGRGVADLLHGVEEYHSLNLSAKNMGMAYSKAWRIVKLAEEPVFPMRYRSWMPSVSSASLTILQALL